MAKFGYFIKNTSAEGLKQVSGSLKSPVLVTVTYLGMFD